MKRQGIAPIYSCACGDHAWAPLTRGYIALVSVEDAPLLSAGFWTAHLSTFGQVYAKRNIHGRRGRTVLLHRMIFGLDGPLVDHRNRNGIDCRRGNLRPATKSQNAVNTSKRNSRSGFIGVTINDGPRVLSFTARISDPRCRQIGTFRTAEEAARAYDQAAVAAYGDFAALNFPADADCRASAEAEIARRDCPAPPAKPSKADAAPDLFGEAA